MSQQNTAPKRALIISDSNIDQDSRVRNQVRWLVNSGFTTDTLGQGDKPSDSNGNHFKLGQRGFIFRLISYLFMPNKYRFKWLTESNIPEELPQNYASYDFIVVNEIDLLPWIVNHGPHLVKPDTGRLIHLDLHEYALSQGVGILWKILFSSYRSWLSGFIPNPIFSSRSVVAQGIAKLYSERYSIPIPSAIMSCPDELQITPSSVDPENIKLIHHGKADLDRGLEVLIDAFEYLDSRFSLTFMLVDSGNALSKLKELSAKYGNRIEFIEPVKVWNVSQKINQFDLEVIVFPPVTENLRFALPNKFFEAVQGRLGLVIGNSPSMLEIMNHWNNGILVDGWKSKDLAERLNSISLEEVVNYKFASHKAAKVLNSKVEGDKFMHFAGEAPS